jgi:putative ABC transport system permease protein
MAQLVKQSRIRSVWDLFLLALGNLLRRPLRSGLTIIGVLIGMAAIVALWSLSSGLSRSLDRQFSQLGYDLVLILPSSPGSFGPPPPMELDLDVLKGIDGLAQLGALLRQTLPVQAGEIQGFLNINGLSPDMLAMTASFAARFDLSEGRLFQDGQSEAVLGSRAAADLKLTLDSSLSINKESFRVVGVLQAGGTAETDSAIYVPLSALWEAMGKRNIVTLAVARAKPDYDVETLASNLDRAIRQVGGPTVTIQTAKRLAQIINDVLSALRGVLSGIAAIALLVGGIGLTNTMYMAVLERTREIGILKALGARRVQILLLFTFEAGLLGLVGGAFGLILGLALSGSVTLIAAQLFRGVAFAPAVTPELVLGSLGFAFALGAVAGLLPSLRAARLRPIEALRYE